MKITFVKKILASGEPCPKCADVEARLIKSGQMSRISRIVIADERNPASEGMKLADKLGVDRAPFFLMEEEGQPPRIYTVYFKFVREVLEGEVSAVDQAREILHDNPDLDFV